MNCFTSFLTAFLLLLTSNLFAATVELLNGTRFEAQIVRKDDENLYVEQEVGTRKVSRTIPLKTIHAVTINGSRRVINEKPAADPNAKPEPADPSGTKSAPSTPNSTTSRDDLAKLIDTQGKTPPDWFEATPLDYPMSLDLSWPEKPEGGWNNQKNVGQYIWDVVNPNQNRWRGGMKLMHHLLTMHKDDPAKREKIMLTMATMYHNLHEDYPRSAFWLRAAGVERDPAEFSRSAVTLADCYQRMGYKKEALELLGKTPGSFGMAKLLGDMGFTDKAVELAISAEKDVPDQAYIVAGDALRVAGRTKEAITWYEKMIKLPDSPMNPGRFQKNRARATANLEGIKLFDQLDPSKVADGDYVSSSQGYEAQVEVTVTMKAGKIANVRVTNHREKQFYSSLSETPARIIAKQHVKGVDATSGATITSDAIINATAKALAKGKP